jgi:carbonic anhydrase
MTAIVAVAAWSLQTPASAANWESMATAGTDRIELDRSRISVPKAHRATAWSRLVRDGIYIDEYGMRYTAVEAFNSYDCAKGSFTTTKRVWRRNGELVREETVARPLELKAEAGSPDARILADVCRDPSKSEGPRESKPGFMRADMWAADEAKRSRTLPVADAAHGEKNAAEKPADSHAAAAEKPAGEKPRYIDLPKVDKSRVEDPSKPMAAPGSKPVPAKPDDMREVAKAAAAAMEKGKAGGADRKDVERQYATSGPRRAAKKKTPKPVEPAAAPAPVEHKHVHWSYEGEGGPDNWGKLEGKYGTCSSGRRQSPIDIRDGIKVDLEPISFNYKPMQFSIVDNGHTVQVNVGDASSISVMGRTYNLVQFHFHRPAEEKIRGKSYDMVAHLVHKDDEGHLAVVAVLMEKGGPEQQLIQVLWNHMPLEREQEVSPAAIIDLNRLLPEKKAYYTYMGSLTTPPCTEDVLWMVLKQPVAISDQQVAIFSRLYKNNARPIQPANERLIKESR